MDHELEEYFDEDELLEITEQRRGAQRDAQHLVEAIESQRLPWSTLEAHLRQPD